MNRLSKHYFDELAKASLEMAGYVKDKRPNVILSPMRSGAVATRFVMESLRKNLKIPASKYDPLIVPIILKYSMGSDVAQDQLRRLGNLRKEPQFRNVYPRTRKAMLIDYTDQGESVSDYLMKIQPFETFREFHVNLLASESGRKSQDELLKDFKRFVNLTRTKSSIIEFDDNEKIIGSLKVATANPRNKFCYSYEPYDSQSDSKGFYAQFSKAIERLNTWNCTLEKPNRRSFS